MNELFTFLLTNVLPPFATAVAAWLFARRKNNAEASSSELENVEKALAIYRAIIHDLHEKIKQLEEELERVQAMLTEYKQKNQHQ